MKKRIFFPLTRITG